MDRSALARLLSARGGLIAVGSLLAVGACSSSGTQSTTGSGGTGGKGGATGGSASTGGGGSASTGGTGGCASQLLCGDGVCCPTGSECVDAACVPACPAAVRCGPVCCPAGDVCSGGTCATPSGSCFDSVDCAPGEYCETVVGQCLPQPAGGSSCVVARPPATFTPELLWSFTAPVARPTFNETVSAPLVVDADKDGTPDVIITTGDINIDNGVNAGYLRLLDGKTGAEKWDETTEVLQPANTVNVTFSPALGDLDGDGKVDIVTMAAPLFQLIAFNADGKVKWRSHDKNMAPFTFSKLYASTVAIADLDHDGKGEVILGGVVFDATGMLVSGAGLEGAGSGAGAYGASSTVVADLDGDGNQEVVTGNTAYRKDGSKLWTQPTLADGFPAIADFDGDGKPEVVVATTTALRVQRGDTGALLHQISLVSAAGAGWTGSPAIADFDGDGKLDIALQFVDGQNTPCSARVYKYDPAQGLTSLWKTPLVACSGFLTPTAFDFDGDGEVEVLAHDDCFVSVLRGKDGTVELRLPASHATWTEFVSVADVNGDGSADILFSTNNSFGGVDRSLSYYQPTCGYTGGAHATQGLFVYHDPLNQWMPTRRVWNQQAYHITNIKSDGTLPSPEIASFGPQGYNNYRVSAQGKGEGNAPDLTVSLAASLAGCPTSLSLVATVHNQGSLGVAAGVSVAFYAGTAPGGALLGTVATTKALLPGATETLTLPGVTASVNAGAFYVVVDEGSKLAECVETNNQGSLSNAGCPVIK